MCEDNQHVSLPATQGCVDSSCNVMGPVSTRWEGLGVE